MRTNRSGKAPQRKKRRRGVIAAAGREVKPGEVIHLLGDVEVLAAESGKAGPRRFKVRAYTGGTLDVANYTMPVVIDLAGLAVGKSVVANLHHEPKAIVGHGTDVANSGKAVDIAGVVSGTGPAATEFLANHDNGFPWQASVEAVPSKLVEVAAGATVEVNGRSFVGPLYVAKKSRLRGVAFLPRGADENTHVTVAAGAADSQKGPDMDPFKKWILAMSLDYDALTDAQRAALKTKFDAEIKASEKEGKETPVITAPAFELEEIKAVANEHLADIELKLATHEGDIAIQAGGGKKLAEIKAAALKDARELKAKAIIEKWAGPKLEVECIKAAAKFEVKLIEAKAPSGPGIISHSSDRSQPVIEAALCMTVGMEKPDKHFKQETLDTARREFPDGVDLQGLLIMAAEARGYPRGRVTRVTQGNLRGLLEYAFPVRREIQAGGFTTIDLPLLFQNTANKEILQGYDTEENNEYLEISQEKSVPDFKAITSYRMLDDMKYEKLAPDGHIKHFQLGEETYTRQAYTYAKMGQLTRPDFINNDLSTFDDLRTRLGMGAKEALVELVWRTFMNNGSFFTTARGNYITGGTTNLGLDGVGLQLAITAFSNLRTPGPNGTSRRKGGRADRLLIPPELQTIADALYSVNNAGPGTTLGNTNLNVNKYRPIVVPWLSDPSFTGYSATAFYLLRNPASLPPIVVSYLNNVRVPTVETADADFDQLGVQFRGFHDFGVDFAEWLAGVKSKGAA